MSGKLDYKTVFRRLENFLVVLTLAGVVFAYMFYAFDTPEYFRNIYSFMTRIFLLYFLFTASVKFIMVENRIEYLKYAWSEVLLAFFVFVYLTSTLFLPFLYGMMEGRLINADSIGHLLLIIYLVFNIVNSIFKGRHQDLLDLKDLKPVQMLALSFIVVIFLGTLFLRLPQAAADGARMPFIDALFTITSATCVTGLTVKDTAVYFTPFGQTVILVFIQIGGLGIMTLSSFFALIFMGKMGVRSKVTMKDVLSVDSSIDLYYLLKTIVLYTFVIEFTGALLLGARWYSYGFGLWRSAALGIFHSVSSFCNAGFSLFSNNLMDFDGDLAVNLPVMLLVLLGGLGFSVLFNIRQLLRPSDGKRPKMQVQTGIVIISTALLIITGAVLFLLLENMNVLKGMPLGKKVLVSFFQSVTPRTAGYNTVDMARIYPVTSFIIIILMCIGASPGSTGGGFKTTTFVLLLAMIRDVLLGRDEVCIYKRSVPWSTVNRAVALIIIYMGLVFIFSFLMLIIDDFDILDTFFEVCSALGTVGLSRGITPALSSAGKMIMIAAMYIGRIGPLTFALAIRSKEDKILIKYPVENMMIG